MSIKSSIGRLLLCAAYGITTASGGGLLVDAEPAAAATITHHEVSKGFEAIMIEGDILATDVEKFRSISLRYKDAIVLLDSYGGALVPALEIGKMIRLTGYSTLVIEGANCTSSCALIWLAGSPRLMSPDGRVGFHASYLHNHGSKEETGVGNAMVGHYLSLLNLPQKAVVFATLAGPDEINWLNKDNRKSAGIEFEDFIVEAPASANPKPVSAPPPIFTVRTPAPIAAAHPIRTSQQPSSYNLSQTEVLLKAAMRDPAMQAKIVASIGVGADAANIFRDHIKKLYSDDRLVHRVAVQLYDARSSMTDQLAMEMGREISQATVMKLMFAGMSRLNDADVRSFLYYMEQLPKSTNAEQCKAIFSQSNPDPMAEFRAVAGLGTTTLSGYLALIRKAINAELSENPAAITVTDSQKKLADKAVEGALAREFLKLNKEDIERISVAFSDLENASPEDACGAYYITFKAMYEMEGLPGAWYRRSFVNSLVEK